MAYAYQQDNEQDQAAQDNAQAASAQGSSVITQDQGPQSPQGQQQNLSSAPSQMGGGSAQSGSQGQPTRKQTPSGGSGFANISNYLEQNQPQAMKLGERVAGSITDKANQAREGIDQGSQSFQDQVNQNMVQYNQDLADRAAQDPSQFAQNQEDVDAFRQMYSGQYQGPQSFEQQENYGDILSQITGAKNQAQLAGTEQGRKQLVTELQQSKRPSQGIASLNNMLLQNSPEAINPINQASEQAFDLDAYFDEVLGESNRLAQQAAEQSALAGQQTQQQFLGEGGVYDQIVGDLDQRVSDARSNAGQTTQQIIDALASGQITPEQASYLGIDESQLVGISDQLGRMNELNDILGNYLTPDQMGQDFSNYLTQTGTPEAVLNRQNVATQDDYLRLQALSDLLGVDNNVLQDQGLGTATDDLVDFDLNNFMGDFSQNLNTREDALKRYQALEKLYNKYLKNDPWAQNSFGVNSFEQFMNKSGFSGAGSDLRPMKVSGQHGWEAFDAYNKILGGKY